MKAFLLSCLMFLLLPLTVIGATTKFTGCLYTVDDNNITVSWTAGQRVDYYEAQLIFLDKTINYTIQTTTTTSINFARPRAGHFKIRVRSCNAFGKSAWVEASDVNYGRVDSQNMAWIIYWKLPAPVVIIE